MKKILLLIAIAAAASGLAQQRVDAGVPYLGTTMVADGNTQSNMSGPRRDPQNGYAYYYRPAGAFYQNMSNDRLVSLKCAPMVIRPYSTVTYRARENGNYEWTYQQGGNWYTTTGNQNLDVTYGCEIDTIPKLKVAPGNVYFTGSWQPEGHLRAEVRAVPDPSDYQPKDYAGGAFYVSPKWWGQGTRDGGNLAAFGTILYNPSDAKYDFQEPRFAPIEYSGRYFGKNTMGIDSATLWVENPNQPYLLRNLSLPFCNLFMTGSAEFDIIIRKAKKDYDSDFVTPGEILYSTSFVLDSSNVMTAQLEYPDTFLTTWHIIQVKKIELLDPVIVDSEIMITLTGYNKENIKDFSLFCSYDMWDEGFGDHGYVYDSVEGRYIPMKNILETGLCASYSALGDRSSTAPSIFMDVKFPYTMLWDEEDMGVRQVGGAGGILAVELKSSDPGSEQQVTIESATPGSDDTSWLTVGFTDGEVSELGEHRLTANLDVAANTTGAPRSAQVTITMPASPTVTLVVNQGTGVTGDVNGDGTVDISDVNAVINVMLGKGLTPDPSPGVEGSPADVNGDGTVDISDVNAIINIMLGKL